MKSTPPGERRLISAVAMAAAVARDPNLKIPSRPKFADGVVMVKLADGLLVEGTAERQVFRGRAATALLPRLLPLLDGTHTLQDTAAELQDVLPEAVHNAVALLYTRGLLYEGTETPVDLATPLTAFFGRHIDTTRVNRSLAEAAGRLGAFRVGITGPAQCAAMLASELKTAGIHGKLIEPSAAGLAGLDLVVALALGSDCDSWPHLDKVCKEHKVPWLRSVFAGTTMEFGPRFAPPETCCYGCFSAMRAHASKAIDAANFEPAWLAFLATDIVYHASRICPPSTARDVVHLDLRDWTQLRARPPKRPGCAVCGRIGGAASQELEAAYLYEQSIEFPPKNLMNPKDHQVHYRLANLELQYDQKRIPTAPLISLANDEASLAGTLDPVKVGFLLSRTAGRRGTAAHDSKVQRWAPTGGNLGSVQVYLLANEIDGLNPGCYFYEADIHSLSQLAPERTKDEMAFLIRTATGSEEAAAFIFTAAYSRVSFKYGAFAYRTIHLDAGVAVAQLANVASICGVRCRVATRWDGLELARELGLGEKEPITTVVGLGTL